MKKILRFDQCDTLLMKNRNKMTITLLNSCFTLFSDCKCLRQHKPGEWIDHHYYFKGKYKKEDISGIDILTTDNKTYSVEIYIKNEHNPIFTLPNIEEANRVVEFFDEWLGWD